LLLVSEVLLPPYDHPEADARRGGALTRAGISDITFLAGLLTGNPS
jgi:hypothetical protein